MIELTGNIWDLATENDLICITTNGFVKSDGSCVMGRGIALEAKRRFPNIEYILGDKIRRQGNMVHWLCGNILSFPVKPVGFTFRNPNNVVTHMRDKFSNGDFVPGWACKADIENIVLSCNRLVHILTGDDRSVYLPRMGCGAGELNWQDVKPRVERILVNDKFKVCTF